MSGDVLSRVRGEIEARLRELQPAVLEYEQLLQAVQSAEPRDGAADRPAGARSRPTASGTRAAASRGRGGSPRGAAQLAIVAALEHGSHTVGELVVVTAMPASSVRESLRRLSRAGTVRKAERDGRPAYALSEPAA